MNLAIDLHICLYSVCLYIHISMHTSIHPCIHLPTSIYINGLKNAVSNDVNSKRCQSTQSIHLSIHPSDHPSPSLPLFLFIHLNIVPLPSSLLPWPCAGVEQPSVDDSCCRRWGNTCSLPRTEQHPTGPSRSQSDSSWAKPTGLLPVLF